MIKKYSTTCVAVVAVMLFALLEYFFQSSLANWLVLSASCAVIVLFGILYDRSRSQVRAAREMIKQTSMILQQNIVIADATRIMFASDVFCRMIGQSEEQLYHGPVLPWLSERLEEHDMRELWLPNSRDDRAAVSSTGHPIRLSGKQVYLIQFFESYQEKDIKYYEHRLQSLLDESSDFMGIVELSGRYHYMNRPFRQALEFNAEAMPTVFVFEWHTETSRQLLMNTGLPSAQRFGTWTGEGCLLTKSGVEVPALFTVYAHKDKEESLQYYSIIIRQHAHVQAEKEARLSQLLLQKTMLAQEDERQRLAHELHDGIGQSLYSILLGMQYLQGTMKKDINKQLLQQWIDEMHQAISKVKFFTIQLRPHMLDQLGLSPAIEQLIHNVSRIHREIHISFFTNMITSQRFNEVIEICIYRIVQEALHNVVKHAQAHSVTVELSLMYDTLRLTVTDDGRGFIRTSNSEGLGLRQMEERANAVGGSFDLHSTNRGTNIKVMIPLEEMHHDTNFISG